MRKVKSFFYLAFFGTFLSINFINCGSFTSNELLSSASTKEEIFYEQGESIDISSPENIVLPNLPATKDVVSPEVSTDLNLIPDGNPLRAFPGAEGFGSETIGGRGGSVCVVDNLNDSGVGSLRDCAQVKSGPRIVVFRVGGTIELKKTLTISNPFISIYGQTAPGSGILVRSTPSDKAMTLSIQTNNVVIQHMRFRAGMSNANSSACCRDAGSIASSKPNQVHHVVLDHNSFSWGGDEIFDTWFDNRNITLSYNIFSEGLHDNGFNSEGPAGRGLIIGSKGAGNISIHHNLIIHSYTRNPLVKTSGIVDIVNNLVYHWTGRAAIQETEYGPQKVNWVKNRWIAERNHAISSQKSPIVFGDIYFSKNGGNPKANMFLKGNIGYHRRSDNMPEWAGVFSGIDTPYKPVLGYHTPNRFKAPPVEEVSAMELEDFLVSRGVGALLPKQDDVDRRLMRELKTRTGIVPNCVSASDRGGEARCKLNVGGWPEMKNGMAPEDKDRDGIPDAWEKANGLNPNDRSDSQQDQNSDGYTNFEDWLYSLMLVK